MSDGDPVKEALKGASTGIARELARGDDEQLPLFELPCADPRGKVAEAIGRGGGRPKGAQNLATREVREYLVKRMGGTPQEHLARWFVLGPEGLAEALGCKKAEAFDRWVALGDKLGRYFMAAMVPVDHEGKPAPQFVVAIGGQVGVVTSSGEVRPPWTYLEENQALSERDAPQSKDEKEGKQ